MPSGNSLNDCRCNGHAPIFAIAARCSTVGYPLFFCQLYSGYNVEFICIYSSRCVFANTEAAAIEANFESPFTMQAKLKLSKCLKRLPSISKKSGFVVSRRQALCMPTMEALRILISSISVGSTGSTAHAIASFSMMGRNKSRCFSVIFLESLSH
ncbi:MAG: hypothetical protein RL757_2261 [Bacteroidota bacterium]